MATKDEILDKIIIELPMPSIREEMSDSEWYSWFEEVYDKAYKEGYQDAINKTNNLPTPPNKGGDDE